MGDDENSQFHHIVGEENKTDRTFAGTTSAQSRVHCRRRAKKKPEVTVGFDNYGASLLCGSLSPTYYLGGPPLGKIDLQYLQS